MILTSEMRKETCEKRIGGETDYERVTYRTITRTEFQKRRASFEKNDFKKGLEKRARSMDELPKTEARDEENQEKEMTDKLEDIHRMIKDMQELTRQLKDRKSENEERPGSIRPGREKTPGPMEGETLAILSSARTAVPVRYRSTILIVIGSNWHRYREEVELLLAPK